MRKERLLLRVLRAARSRIRRGEEVQISHLVEPLGPDASTVGCIIVAAPFLAPFSLGPLCAPASLYIALAGIHLIRSSPGDAGPPSGLISTWRARLLGYSIPHRVYHYIHKFLGSLASLLRRYSRPRLESLVHGGAGRTLVGLGFILGAVVLVIPTPGVPLMNTLPALAIILLAAASIRRDGLLVIGSYVTLLATVAIIVGLALGIGVLGMKGLGAVRAA